ncbi:hypothetical protein SAMN05444145_105236 [Alistipes timonensis JC136]|uniref:Uncharacterized protein n=1 Tax=Alistipes timonensis JC136 TaxID=1033731 RepID=A0A1H4DCR0_9BACT|nr:hypothetical protein [Alistipes timonensis]SEA70531.1 hypothetical protein SAMN05444145_105236 [Alistipes timonensis JC136]
MTKPTLTPEEKAAKAAEKAAKAAEKEAADKAAAEKVAREAAEKAAAEQAAREAAEKAAAEQAACKAAETVEKTPPSPATSYAASPAELAARETTEKAAAEEAARKAAEPKAGGKTRLEKEGERILAEYPDASEVFMTANGFGFFREADARNHAATLRDKTITNVKRK